ncbi:MAG: hypothetical protein KF819_27140 [Labilithrix sp.]|nr:hypothetical protein [Labilithrix sp.]
MKFIALGSGSAVVGVAGAVLIAACTVVAPEDATGGDAPDAGPNPSQSGDATTNVPGPVDSGTDLSTPAPDASPDVEAGPDWPPVPDGFTRVVLAENCAPGSELFTAHEGLIAPPATCSSCDVDPTPLTVNECTVDVTRYANSRGGGGWYCSGLVVSTYVASSTCTPNPSVNFDAWSAQTSWGEAAGTCNPPTPQTPTIPAVTWVDTVHGCSSAPAGKTCIYQAGDVDCPASDYTSKRLLFTGVSDTRGCSDCTATFESTCRATLTRWVSTDCSTNRSGDTGCIPGGAYVKLVNVNPIEARCSASGGEPTGQATQSDAVTLCCPP